MDELSVLLQNLLEQKVSCEQVTNQLQDYSFEQLENVFANLYHYLNDEDIRLKDKEYKVMQDAELLKLIEHLKNNNINAANTISFLHVS